MNVLKKQFREVKIECACGGPHFQLKVGTRCSSFSRFVAFTDLEQQTCQGRPEVQVTHDRLMVHQAATCAPHPSGTFVGELPRASVRLVFRARGKLVPRRPIWVNATPGVSQLCGAFALSLPRVHLTPHTAPPKLCFTVEWSCIA